MEFPDRSGALERYGPGVIPPGSTVADWPLGYEELEPYYDRVEYLFGVSGKAGNVRGRIDPGGNVFEGPRSREYPLPPLRRTGFMDVVDAAARRLGWHPFQAPAAIHSQPYAGLPACEYRGFCTAGGCHVNGKAGTHVTGIPQAEATGKLKVVAHARVTSVATDREGRVSGVVYVQGGRSYFQPARVVLLAAYTYENVRLLLLSRSKAYPDGLSNNHGQVGKHFTTHSHFGILGYFPGRRLNRYYGNGPQNVAVDDFEGGVMDARGLGFMSHSVVYAGVGEAKPIILAHMSPPSVPRWGAVWKDWLKRNVNSVMGAAMILDHLTYEQNVLDLDPTHRDPYGVPVIRATFDITANERRAYAFYREKLVEWLREAGAAEVWGAPAADPTPVSTHAFGGARMGDDPETSVVDRFGFSHEAPNLGVLGGATFVTGAGRNPTETIWALAWRTADHLLASWEAIAA